MNSSTEFLNTARTFYEARHEPESMRPLAEWYWKTLLVITFLGLVGILAHGTWNFIGVLQKLSASEGLRRSNPPEILSRKDLADMLALYEARLAAFEEAKRTRSDLADPSR